jgi:hypothetical protein
MMEMAIARLECAPAEALAWATGWIPISSVLMRLGIRTALVMSGVTKQQNWLHGRQLPILLPQLWPT